MTCFCLDPAYAAESKKGSTAPRRLGKTTVRDVYGSILINNIFNLYSNNGDGSYDPSGNRSGFEFPKGSGKTAIFEDGLVWGGKHNGVIKVGGSTYQHGLQPGRITTPGTPTTSPFADNVFLEKYRLFRVRRDINPATSLDSVQDKINEELTLLNRYQSLTAEQVYNNYLRDWNEWPASDGAPFEDVDGNGSYNPVFDIPGVPGADQTLWHVSNDLDGGLTAGLYGSEPIGLEFQRTMWAYRSTGGLGSTIFLRYRIINLSGHPIDSMFVSQWSDPDVGNGGDDFVGCDTALSMGYAYNSSDFDQIYGATSPAVGYDFLQGPIVPAGPEDRAMFGGRYRFGYKNLPMSSFNFYVANAQDPPPGSPDGTRQWYNLMNGLTGSDGQEFVDPTTGQRTKFALAGDPVNWTGWVDGMNTWQGDKRIVLSSGPFTLADRDTQEVVVCVMAAQGSDRLASITALRSVDRIAQSMYNSLFTFVRPEFSCKVAYPTGTEATVAITGVGGLPRPDFVRISLHRVDGAVVGTVDLLDDGAHQDGMSGDGVYGGSITIPREPGAMTCDAEVYVNEVPLTFTRVLESITTAGDLELLGATVFSDNLNSDRFVNPGENIRYGFTILNNTMFSLNALSIVPFPGWWQSYYIGQLASGNQNVRVYDPGNDQSYFSFDAPNNPRDTVARIVLTATDTLNNVWRDTLAFRIYPVPVQAYGVPVERVAGDGHWTFSAKVVDRTSLTNHYMKSQFRMSPASGTLASLISRRAPPC